jgi:hypothetical protein
MHQNRKRSPEMQKVFLPTLISPSYWTSLQSTEVCLQIRQHVRQTSIMQEANAPVFINNLSLLNAISPELRHIPISSQYDLLRNAL